MGEVWGADLAQLRALAREFDTAAQTLDTAVSEVTSMLSSVDWLGPGGDQFRAEWDGHHAPAMRDVSTNLAEVRSKIERNADQQDETSNDYAGAGIGAAGAAAFAGASATGSGTVSGGGDDGNWAKTVLDVVGDANWVATAGGLVHNGIELGARWAHGLWNVADALPGGWGGAIGTAGKAFAWGSVAFGAFQMGQGIGEGDYWMAGDGAISAGLGVGGLLVAAGLVSNPVGWAILGAGAAWAVADLLIDGNVTEVAWNAAKDVGGWVGDTAGDIADGVGDLAGDVLDAGGDLLDGAKDLLPW